MVLNFRRTLKRDILHFDDVLGEWVKVSLGYALALSSIGSVTIPWESNAHKALRTFIPICGIVTAAYSTLKVREIEQLKPFLQYKDVARHDVATMAIARQVAPYFAEPDINYLPAATEQLAVQQLDPIALKKQHTGLLVCGDSGSAKTTLIRYCLPYWVSEGYQVIVLDPHADRENPEYPWADFPYIVGDRHAIFEQIKILLDLLESKDRTKVICICDEWTDLLGFAQLESRELFNTLRNFLIRWGTGGRKFGKFLVGIGHTDNVEMWGLKGVGGLIRNFGILRLGEIATRYAELNCKHSDLHQYCVQTAYPLLVEDKVTIHPTHGQYQSKENGQHPVNLQPLNFHPLTIEFVGNLGGDRRPNLHKPEPSHHSEPPPPPHHLNRLLSLDYSPSEPLEPITDNWDGSGEIPPHITAELVRGIRSGLSKNQIIVEILETPKGGSKRYKALSQYHDELRQNIL
jgi:hypothetical protein